MSMKNTLSDQTIAYLNRITHFKTKAVYPVGKFAKSYEANSMLEICISLPYQLDSLEINDIHRQLELFFGLGQYRLTTMFEILPHAVKAGIPRLKSALSQVKNVIAVGSAKGGVGKSSTAYQLALSLQQQGAKVGLLDADIHGPSLALMAGIKDEKPIVTADKKFMPLEKNGLKLMSIAFLIDETQAMIWRGPMVSQAFSQLFFDTAWGELDYLILDLPPGTGDIQLTLSQKIPVSALIMVSTPQDLALIDVKKGIAMFEKVNIPILGIVENMSVHVCQACQHVTHIFGHEGIKNLAAAHDLTILGTLPLAIEIREASESGLGLSIGKTYPDREIAKVIQAQYDDFAHQVALTLHQYPRDYSSGLNQIKVTKTAG
jgi:ATP-binding protein involved in chromosome partitioning